MSEATEKGIGEQALDKAAEIGLSSQLDEVEKLDVDIEIDPLKVVGGEVDQVAIAGEGMVMQKDLRVTKMDMKMDSVAINPMSAAMGKIELTKPTNASTHVVLTEADINRAFNSDYVRQQLQQQQINVNGQQTTTEPQQIDFRLPGEGKIALNAVVKLPNTGKTEQVAFTAVPQISNNGHTVTLEDVQYGEQEELSPELTKTLVQQASEILNLSNFDLEGISLRIQHLEVETGKLIIQAEAHVEQMPSA